jgi:DNA-binding beta-propeller fold protein YncE
LSEAGARTRRDGLGYLISATALGLALVALIGAIAAAENARAEELAWRGCFSGDPEFGPSGSGACTNVANFGSEQFSHSVAVSPDGRSLYTAGPGDIKGVGGITRFDRDSTTGALTYRGCITGDEEFGPSSGAGCAEIPSATPQGYGSGLDRPVDVTVSPDGNSVYVAATGDSAVARFNRNASTGALAYRGCITGNKALGPSGTGACNQIPSATAGGGDLEGGMQSGLGRMTALAVSPDGNSLYVTSDVVLDGEGDAAVARFDRHGTGALAYRDCISGNKALGPSGSGACKLIPTARTWALGSGLSPIAVSLSPDRKSLYTVSQAEPEGSSGSSRLANGSNALDRFDRNSTTGALTYRGCITGDMRSGPSGSGACRQIPTATKHGYDSRLPNISLAPSPDGKTLYTGGLNQVAWLDRDPTTGALSYGGCITGDNGGSTAPAPGVCRRVPHRKDPGMSGQSLAMSPDGETLYAGFGFALTRLDADSGSGALGFRDCVTSNTLEGSSGSGPCTTIPSASKYGQGSGFDVRDIAPSEDGKSLYTAGLANGLHLNSRAGGTVARFGFAPQTRISRATVRRHLASFSFRADKPSTFECKLNGKRVKPKLRHWRHCGASALRYDGKVRYLHLHSGRRTLRVRATDAIGDTDPTPAKRRWRIQ